MAYCSALKGNPAVCNNMNKPEGHHAKWNKPVTEIQVLHYSTYELSKTVRLTDTEYNGGLGGNGELLFNGNQVAVIQEV